MYKKKFFFIVFEGVEGTGKSFQIERLRKNLKKNNLNCIKTREPGGSKSAEKIRKLIFAKNSNKFHKLTDFYLMLASRNEHIHKTILKAKKNKQIVISDRFTDSTYAYQVMGNNIDKKINDINKKYITNNLKPDLTIVLKSNMKTISMRLKKRKITNKFDKLSINFYIKAQKSFLKIAKNKKNYCIFDSSKNNNNVENKIISIILKKINR